MFKKQMDIYIYVYITILQVYFHCFWMELRPVISTTKRIPLEATRISLRAPGRRPRSTNDLPLKMHRFMNYSELFRTI